MDDDQFRKLLDHLGYSWTGYRKVRKGVKKRIRRHMQQLQCRDITSYLKMLDRQPDDRQECELLMTVSISRFFRDPQLWKMLECLWLPEIIAKNPLKLKVWSAGCGCGQEPYSFKIVWQRLKKRFDSLPSLEITATDRHPQYLELARKGIYDFSSLKEVTVEDLSAYFESRKGENKFAIGKELKRNIHWRIHHLLTAPPGPEFNLIFLRNNILTYYHHETKTKALTGILNCLSPGGVFIIGTHETLPFKPDFLTSMNRFPYVFYKRP